MTTFSNEAQHLHRMCTELHSLGGGPSSRRIFCDRFGIEENSAEYFAAVSAIASRFRYFGQLVSKSNVSERLQTRTLQAIHQISQFLRPEHAAANWDQVKNQFFTPESMTALEFAGGLFGDHSPVVELTKEEIDEQQNKLTVAIASLAGLDDPMVHIIATSLDAAVEMFQQFDVYGSTRIAEELLRSKIALEHVAESAPKNSRKLIRDSIIAVSAAAAMLISTDAGITAIENHYTRVMIAMEKIGLLEPATTKLLTGPSGEPATDESEPTEPTSGPTTTTDV